MPTQHSDSASKANKGSGAGGAKVLVLAAVASIPGAHETAVFAGGCFWGVQAVFQHTQGVLNAVSGYAGGQMETANYQSVGSGQTGHAESVQVTYDPQQICYGKLLQVYFSVAHEPTEINRQGPDHGAQYRCAVFYQDAQQKQVAERYIAQLDAARVFPRKIATQLTPLDTFYPAEAHHQDYATRNPHSPYVATYDLPKIANLKALLPEVYRESPVLVASQAAAASRQGASPSPSASDLSPQVLRTAYLFMSKIWLQPNKYGHKQLYFS